MTADQQAIERAAWAVATKAVLAEDFTCREHLNDYSTMFMVTHPENPGWKAKVTIHCRGINRTQIDLNAALFTYSFTRRDRLVEALHELRLGHAAATVSAQEKEAAAAKWMAKQEAELAGLKDIRGATAQIIRRGPYVGQYRVTLSEGHPLEHLTLEQFKTFHAFLQSLSRS